MPQKIISTLYWLLSLGKVFTKNAPLATFAVVTMTFLSQLCMIVAFLLPIKVVMLLGTSGTLDILPAPLQNIEKDLLILWMGVITLLFYGAMHLTQRLSEKASKFGAQTILVKNQKLVLFENQHEIASNTYSRYAYGLAGLNFSLFGLIFLGFIYTEVAAILASAIIIFLIGLTIISNSSDAIKYKLEENANQVSSWLSDFGFMVVFVYIVLDYLYFVPPTFILAIIAIIVTRIMLGRLQFSLNQFIALVNQEHKINALFFAKHSLQTKTTKSKSVWDVISSTSFELWLKKLISEGLSREITTVKLEARDSRLKDTAILTVKLLESNTKFLVKVFGPKANLKAIHEASLILDYSDQLPAPPTFNVTTFEQFHCHIFDVSTLSFNKPKKQSFEQTKIQLLEDMASAQLNHDFIARYERSKPYLWDKINQDLFQRLETVSSSSEKVLISQLKTYVPKILEILKSLPLTVYTPINKDEVMYTENDVPVLIDWTKWGIQPIGAGLSPNKVMVRDSASRRFDLIAEKLSSRLELTLKPEDIELSSLIQSLMFQYESQHYREIINNILPMLTSNLSKADDDMDLNQITKTLDTRNNIS